MPDISSPSVAAGAAILVPSTRFFTRRITLVATSDAASQVELALEGLSPFPIDQLNHGFLLSPAGDEALIYAAYRKHFSAEETAAWETAGAVLPEFAALLGDAPPTAAIRCWQRGGQMTAVGWDGAGSLPALISAREDAAGSGMEKLVAKLRTRLDPSPGDVLVEKFNGDAEIRRDVRTGSLSLSIRDSAKPHHAVLNQGALGTMDVRDKTFLKTRQGMQRRDRILVRGFQAAVAGIALLLFIEGALLAGNIWLARREAAVAGAAAAVAKIEAAQALSARVEEISRRQLRPFEMLGLVNRDRPESVLFLRATTQDQLTIEIEAQTPSADDVNHYEETLRQSPAVAKVEIRDLRSRDGITSFILAATFRPKSVQPEDRP